MTELQHAEVSKLKAKGYSNLYISACVDNVSYQQIEAAFPTQYPGERFSPAYQAWRMQQPWVWRPDNKQPTEAPWERISREWF